MVFCNNHTEVIQKKNISHNPYFNRWFSAIWKGWISNKQYYCHNPYFNRWFSAIDKKLNGLTKVKLSQSLF